MTDWRNGLFLPEGLPRWPGDTVVILGGGASLDQNQVDRCRGRARVIAINRAWVLAPWADWLHAYDEQFCQFHSVPQRVHGRDYPPIGDFAGIKTTGCQAVVPGFVTIKMAPKVDGEGQYRVPFADPRRPVHVGRDSGYQAVQLAALVGGDPIVLLGMDARPNGNWHGGYSHRWSSTGDFTAHIELHRVLAGLLAERGVGVLNATPGSAIDAYERVSLEEALA